MPGSGRHLPSLTVSHGPPDLAEALEFRDELLIACREVLLGVGTPEAAALVGQIDVLLVFDDEAGLPIGNGSALTATWTRDSMMSRSLLAWGRG